MNIDDYRQALDGITATQEEKIMAAKNITEKYSNEKKPRIRIAKRTATLIAAAAVLACGTLTVGAVCDWNYSSLFNRFFASTANPYLQAGISDSGTEMDAEWQAQDYKQYDFSGMGKDINESVKFENFTLKINSLIADENCAYLLYDVVFDEGYNYTPMGYDDWSIIADGNLKLTKDAELSADAQLVDFGEVRFVGKNKNVYSYCSLMGYTYPLSGQSIEYTFGPLVCCDNTVSLKSDEPSKTIVLPCDYKYTVDIDFDVNAYTVSATANAPSDLGNWGTGTITAVKLTPLMLTVDVADYNGFKDNFDAKAEIAEFDVMLSDGGEFTALACDNDGDINGDTCRLTFIIASPVDTSKVKSIKIGSAVIDIAK